MHRGICLKLQHLGKGLFEKTEVKGGQLSR